MTSAVRLAPYLMLAWGLFLFLQGIEAPQPPDLPDPADPETATDYDTDEEGLPAMPRAPPEIPNLLDDPEPVNENPGRHQTEVVDLPVLRRGQTQILPEPQPAQGERPPRSMGQQSNAPLLAHERDALQHPPQAQGAPGPRDLLHDPDLQEREPGPHALLHDSDLPDQDPMPFPDPPRHDILLPPRPRLQEDPALPVLRHRGPGPRDPLHDPEARHRDPVRHQVPTDLPPRPPSPNDTRGNDLCILGTTRTGGPRTGLSPRQRATSTTTADPKIFCGTLQP